MKKKITLSLLALSLTFTLLMSFVYAAGNTDVNDRVGVNDVNRTPGAGYGTTDTRMNDTRTNGVGPTDTGVGNYRNLAANDDATDWGWLGLLGLVGLAGMFGRNRNPDPGR